MALAELVRFVWVVCALTSLVQPPTQAVLVALAILVWRARVYRELVRPRRRRVLVPEVMRVESALKVFAAIMFAASTFQPDHVMVERFAIRPRERLPVLSLPAAPNTLAVLASVKMKSVLAAYAPCLLAVKTY